MNKFIVTILSLLMFTSCQTDDVPYSYLSNMDVSVELTYKVEKPQTPFIHALQALEMYLEWGDGTQPMEYVYRESPNVIDSIKPISHTYRSIDEYTLTVRALKLRSLLLSKSGDNVITQLKMNDCKDLRRLYCENQPILDIDVSASPALSEFSCGFPQGTQTISDIAVNKKLKLLSIHGHTNFNDWNLSSNESLEELTFKGSNIIKLETANLQLLSSITLDNCASLQYIYLSGNPKLKQLVFRNNPLLDDYTLNSVFQSLPQATDGNHIIQLSGNKGDATCDRSIANSKGWVFN